MLLKSPGRMAELFALFNKTPTAVYPYSELNEAMDYAGIADSDIV